MILNKRRMGVLSNVLVVAAVALRLLHAPTAVSLTVAAVGLLVGLAGLLSPTKPLPPRRVE